MSKRVSAGQLARLLADAAEGLTPQEVLGDTVTNRVAKIADHMPPELLGLLPQKYLH
jgi:hypothetical protein